MFTKEKASLLVFAISEAVFLPDMLFLYSVIHTSYDIEYQSTKHILAEILKRHLNINQPKDFKSELCKNT